MLVQLPNAKKSFIYLSHRVNHEGSVFNSSLIVGFLLEILPSWVEETRWDREFVWEQVLQEGSRRVRGAAGSVTVPGPRRLSWSPTAAWASAGAPCATRWPPTASAATATGSHCPSRSRPSSTSCAWPTWRR